jgi:hypothetical protein
MHPRARSTAEECTDQNAPGKRGRRAARRDNAPGRARCWPRRQASACVQLIASLNLTNLHRIGSDVQAEPEVSERSSSYRRPLCRFACPSLAETNSDPDPRVVATVSKGSAPTSIGHRQASGTVSFAHSTADPFTECLRVDGIFASP